MFLTCMYVSKGRTVLSEDSFASYSSQLCTSLLQTQDKNEGFSAQGGSAGKSVGSFLEELWYRVRCRQCSPPYHSLQPRHAPLLGCNNKDTVGLIVLPSTIQSWLKAVS